MSRAFLTPIGASPLAADPSSATEGDLYYNTVDNTIKYYTGAVWVAVASISDLDALRSEIPIYWPEEAPGFVPLSWPSET